MKPKNHGPRQNAEGFTLTELLVVIVIICILGALSLAGIHRIRQSAQLAKCTENLHIWGIAIQSYAAEHNGNVQWKDWASISTNDRYYETYLGGDVSKSTAVMDGRNVLATQLFRRCPSQRWDGTGNGPVGYAMTRPNPKISSSETYKLSTAINLAQLLLLIDADALNLNGPSDIPGATNALLNPSTQRHCGKLNALFGDGHVSSYQAGDLKDTGMLTRWFTLK